MLYGRSEQLAAIGRLLEDMRSGRAGALVLRGEAGIGKTALLEAAADKAAGARVLRVAGVESEAELPFAALHALLRPALDQIGALPGRQAAALRGALGLAEETGADRFLVGLGVLSLIAELAEDRPVLVLADDAQWLDRASGDALVFAARRLQAEQAAVLVAARDEPPGTGLPGLPELRVGGLDQAAAEQLLAGAGLVRAVRDQLIAEAAGLVRVTPAGVIFSHPLARAAVLAGSDVAERAAAHRALAGVLDGDRRAWHLAALADGPDEQVAAELDAAAQRADRRGSRAAASAAYERAAALSAGLAAKGRRLALAAEAATDAGQLPRAADLAGRAGQLVTDPAAAMVMARVRAQLEFEAGRPADSVGILLEWAALLGPADPGTAEAVLAEAVHILWLAAGPAHPELEQRAAAMTPPVGARLVEFLQAVRRLQDGDTDAPVTVPATPDPGSRPFLAGFSQLFFDFVRGDVPAVGRRAADMAAECRDAGIAGLLAYALVYLAIAQLLRGEFLDAIATTEEGLRIAADTGQTHVTRELACTAAGLAAITGDEEACRARAAQVRELSAGVQTLTSAGADCALAMLDLGCGRYQSALGWMRAATHGPARRNPELLYAYPVHVEAAVRAGRTDLAARPLAQFTAWAGATGQRWATAVAARCAALTADDADAEPLWREAIAAHEGDGRPFEQARTRLLYGEWLRRNRRRAGAREHLLAAAAAFARMEARPWQKRAEAELRAAGAGAPAVTADDPLARLTPQELQVVRLAAAGASNKQIGAQLFLSPRTVGFHLYRAFPKLGVTTREELARYAP